MVVVAVDAALLVVVVAVVVGGQGVSCGGPKSNVIVKLVRLW